jgi:hypothetical protein
VGLSISVSRPNVVARRARKLPASIINAVQHSLHRISKLDPRDLALRQRHLVPVLDTHSHQYHAPDRNYT